MQHELLKQVLTALDNDNSSTLYEFVLQTLPSWDPTHQRHWASLLSHIPHVLDALSEKSSEALATGAIQVAAATCQFELRALIHPQNGFHFTGTSASLDQLEDFSIIRMGHKIQEVAPNLWQLLGDLLNADQRSRGSDTKGWCGWTSNNTYLMALNKKFGGIGYTTHLQHDQGTNKTKLPHWFLPATVTKYEKVKV